MTGYRIQYTEVKPGGSHAHQDVSHAGTLEDVRDYVNHENRHVFSADSIVITEYRSSDSIGRTVPASEWDVYED